MMATDLTVILEDRPGTLAELGETLGKSNINIEGICGFPCEGKGTLHVLVQDGEAAAVALQQAGLSIGNQRQVLVVEIDDRPGTFGEMTRQFAEIGVNVDLVYLTTRSQLVIGVDDLNKASSVID